MGTGLGGVFYALVVFELAVIVVIGMRRYYQRELSAVVLPLLFIEQRMLLEESKKIGADDSDEQEG